MIPGLGPLQGGREGGREANRKSRECTEHKFGSQLAARRPSQESGALCAKRDGGGPRPQTSRGCRWPRRATSALLLRVCVGAQKRTALSGLFMVPKWSSCGSPVFPGETRLACDYIVFWARGRGGRLTSLRSEGPFQPRSSAVSVHPPPPTSCRGAGTFCREVHSVREESLLRKPVSCLHLSSFVGPRERSKALWDVSGDPGPPPGPAPLQEQGPRAGETGSAFLCFWSVVAVLLKFAFPLSALPTSPRSFFPAVRIRM